MNQQQQYHRLRTNSSKSHQRALMQICNLCVHLYWSPVVFNLYDLEIKLYTRKECVMENYFSCFQKTAFTPASNLGYLAPPPPGQFFMGAKLFIGTPWMGNEGVLKKILVWAMWNCMVSMPTHSEFEKGGLPIKLLISQLLLILDY